MIMRSSEMADGPAFVMRICCEFKGNETSASF
jgi:hypothetical protein